MNETAAEPTPQIPPRANSANSKSKFLTKTQLGTGPTASTAKSSSTFGDSVRPSSEQQHMRGQLGGRGISGAHAPSPSATQ